MDSTPVDDELLKTVAKKLHSRCRTLGKILGIQEERLKNIQDRYKESYLKAMAVLYEWKETAGNNATKENLQNALKTGGIMDCAIIIRKGGS